MSKEAADAIVGLGSMALFLGFICFLYWMAWRNDE